MDGVTEKVVGIESICIQTSKKSFLLADTNHKKCQSVL